MKQLIALAIIIISLTTASAQSGMGFKGGVSMNNRSGYGSTGLKTSPLYTLQASFFFLKDIGSDLLIQPALGYYGKGMQIRDFMFYDNMGNILGTGRLNTRFDYLEFALPLMLRVVNNSETIIFGGAGPYMAYAFAGKYVIRGINNLGEIPKSSDVDFEYNNRFDAGVTVQASMVLKNKFMLSVNYDQGITKVIKNSGITSRNVSYGFTAGYILKSK